MQKEKENIVSIAACNRYHLDTVRAAYNELFAPWGGIAYFVKPRQKILLKPNLLAAVKPSEAVTTHPTVVRILAELIQEAGGEVYIGDSPGNDRVDSVYRETEMEKTAEETKAKLIKFDRANKKDYDSSSKYGGLEIAAILDEMDVVINVAKLKTHPLTGMTAAVKNTYGCIVGAKKARMHFEHPIPQDFANMLIDVYLAVKPALSIIDAVVALEGMGPRRGKPRPTGLLMASPNAVALDSAAANIAGFSPNQVTTLVAARQKKLFGANLAEVQVHGLSLEDSRIKDFDTGISGKNIISRLVTWFPLSWASSITNSRRPYPYFDETLCNGCGQCAEGCPCQIINLDNGIPGYEPGDCIRCYCCGEFCPRGAVKL